MDYKSLSGFSLFNWYLLVGEYKSILNKLIAIDENIGKINDQDIIVFKTNIENINA